MYPLLFAVVGGYLIGDSMKKKQVFAEGGMAGDLPSFEEYKDKKQEL